MKISVCNQIILSVFSFSWETEDIRNKMFLRDFVLMSDEENYFISEQ